MKAIPYTQRMSVKTFSLIANLSNGNSKIKEFLDKQESNSIIKWEFMSHYNKKFIHIFGMEPIKI